MTTASTINRSLSSWWEPESNWRHAKTVTLGIDVGCSSSQAAVAADGNLIAYVNLASGSKNRNSARIVYNHLLFLLKMEESRIDYCVGTGYGGTNLDLTDRPINELACHAKGAHYLFGSKVRTVLDIGGHNLKLMRCDARGKVTKFLVNDYRSIGVDKWNPNPETWIQPMECLTSAITKKFTMESSFAISGGLAKCGTTLNMLGQLFGMNPVPSKWDCQITGAVGAALFAYEQC